MCFSKCVLDGGDTEKCKQFCSTITGPGTPVPSRRRPLSVRAANTARVVSGGGATVVGQGPAPSSVQTIQIGTQQPQWWWNWWPYYSYPYAYAYSGCPWGSYYDPYIGTCVPTLYGYGGYGYGGWGGYGGYGGYSYPMMYGYGGYWGGWNPWW